jgi:hypothetical protein
MLPETEVLAQHIFETAKTIFKVRSGFQHLIHDGIKHFHRQQFNIKWNIESDEYLSIYLTGRNGLGQSIEDEVFRIELRQNDTYEVTCLRKGKWLHKFDLLLEEVKRENNFEGFFTDIDDSEFFPEDGMLWKK